jgi:FkbM family methyltransferase
MKLHRLLLPKLYARLEALKTENHRLKHQLDQVVSIEYAPPVSSPFYYRDKPLLLPLDKVMIPHLLQSGNWQEDMLEFARGVLSKQPGKSYYFFDVGANVGLITRQFLAQFPSIVGATCVEPDPENFAFLKKNNDAFENVSFLNYALSNTAGKSTFYRDSINIGRYSLIPQAMNQAKSNVEIVVECRKVTDELLLGPVPADARLIWKSDTEGYDEIIATELSPAFWARVDLAILELWPIGKPKYDVSKLEAILDSFPRKHFASDLAQTVSTARILAFIAGENAAHCDLYMAR